MVVCYTLLKLKAMVNHEDWSLNNQTVMSEKIQLENSLNFTSFPNVTIALQFSKKPVILT